MVRLRALKRSTLTGLLLVMGVARAHADDAVLWSNGEARGAISLEEVANRDLAVLDLSEGWVPPLFVGYDAFVPTYVTLARGRFDDLRDPELARRARLDRFLESYGIPPTLSVLRDRLRELGERPCSADLEAIARFHGSDIDEDDLVAWEAEAVPRAEEFVQQLLVRENALGPSDLNLSRLTPFERMWLGRAAPLSTWRRGLAAVRERLRCEDVLGRQIEAPELDRGTRLALASFERRHRIYARGRLSGDTLRALGTPPRELARQDVLRVLTERARLDWGLLADGTAAPDRLGPVRRILERAFGLQTPDSTLAWLEGLELDERAVDEALLVAVPAPTPTPDDDAILDLRVEIDRGDQVYDPPTAGGVVRIRQRPTLTLFVRRGEAWVALVRWPTTVGGWRILREEGQDVWRYKESPAGPGIWREIHAAPVWIPPSGVPDESLVIERHVEDGEITTEVKSTLLGPGYASAFGLAAALHRPLRRDGSVGDYEGIRTHGSVDYTSVWRRASLGCHRLENHRAVALFSFLLKHRRHRRVGSRQIGYSRPIRVGDTQLTLEVPRSGYVYVLDPPVPFEVLPGRVIGRVQRVPRHAVPTQ